MCTSVSCSDQALFGRSLDLESPFGEQVVIAPREYPFRFHHRLPLVRHHALIGMAALADGVPLYAEAVNEKGLYMAGLNFPASACYFPDDDNGRSNGQTHKYEFCRILYHKTTLWQVCFSYCIICTICIVCIIFLVLSVLKYCTICINKLLFRRKSHIKHQN